MPRIHSLLPVLVVLLWGSLGLAEDRDTPPLLDQDATLAKAKVIAAFHLPEYIPGQYVCRHFADDFAQTCDASDIPAWVLVFGHSYTTLDLLLYDKPKAHAVNLVEVAHPGPARKFCIIEPQTGESISCWTDDPLGTPTVPPEAIQALEEEWDWFGDQQDAGWDRSILVIPHEDYDPNDSVIEAMSPQSSTHSVPLAGDDEEGYPLGDTEGSARTQDMADDSARTGYTGGYGPDDRVQYDAVDSYDTLAI